jgi:signal transduction histidine kinase
VTATIDRRAPRLTAWVVGVVVAGGAVAVAVAVPDVAAWTGGDALAFLALTAGAAIAEHFQIELAYRTERVTYSVSDALWTAGLLVARPSVLLLSVGCGVVIGQATQPWAPLKVAFNAGQFLLGISAAIAVFELLGSPPPSEPSGWAAAAVAMAAFQAVNTIVMAAIISVTERQPFWSVALVPTGLLHWLGNLATGVLAALVWDTEPAAAPFLLVPIAFTYAAYRGWLETIRERDQMHEIARAADEISVGGDLQRRVPDTGSTDAVGVLASTLNRMLDRVDDAFRRERLFISETSHELRTPITICRGHLEDLGPAPSAAEVADTVAVVTDELDRMARLVADMATLARMEDPESLHLTDVDLNQLVTDVAAKATTLLDGRLHVSAPPTGQILRADPQRLTQAMINLLNNAAEHTPPGTSIELGVTARPEAWRFEVTDHGRGLAPGDEELVFRPFHTGKDSIGSGLGLVVVSGIARAHGGAAGVESRTGHGATFWMEIPA